MSPRIAKSPVSFVSDAKVSFVETRVRVTSAPGSTAPLVSVTVPTTVTLSPCATAQVAATNRAIKHRHALDFMTSSQSSRHRLSGDGRFRRIAQTYPARKGCRYIHDILFQSQEWK